MKTDRWVSLKVALAPGDWRWEWISGRVEPLDTGTTELWQLKPVQTRNAAVCPGPAAYMARHVQHTCCMIIRYSNLTQPYLHQLLSWLVWTVFKHQRIHKNTDVYKDYILMASCCPVNCVYMTFAFFCWVWWWLFFFFPQTCLNCTDKPVLKYWKMMCWPGLAQHSFASVLPKQLFNESSNEKIKALLLI